MPLRARTLLSMIAPPPRCTIDGGVIQKRPVLFGVYVYVYKVSITPAARSLCARMVSVRASIKIAGIVCVRVSISDRARAYCYALLDNTRTTRCVCVYLRDRLFITGMRPLNSTTICSCALTHALTHPHMRHRRGV